MNTILKNILIGTKGGKFICISKTVPESNESPIGIKVGDKTYIISKWKNEA